MQQLRVMLWVAVVIAGGYLGLRYMTLDIPQPPQSAAVGGPFTLTAHTGETVSNTDFLGRFMLIYFGYSFCPDVCPVELQKLTTALTLLEEEGYDTTLFQPIFITVDPERDTVEALASYQALFHPRLIALTGSLDDIDAVAKAYKIYYSKVDDPTLGTYLMDHFSGIFAMGPAGEFQHIFTKDDTPADIVDVLRPVLDQTGAGPKPVPAAR